MHGDEFANSLSRRCAGIGSGFHRTDITANHNGDISAADMDFTD